MWTLLRPCLMLALIGGLTTCYAEQPLPSGDEQLIKALLASIKESGTKRCHYHPSNAHSDLQSRRFEAPLKEAQAGGSTIVGIPAMVYNPCMHTYSLGNSLGNYFHEASCALEANMSIVFPLKVWDNPYMPLEYRHGKHKGGHSPKDDHDMTLFAQLPGVYTNADPSHPTHRFYASYAQPATGDKVARYAKVCVCERFCWGDAAAPWLRQHRFIREVMTRAINAHFASASAAGTSLHLSLRLLLPDGSNRDTCDFVEPRRGEAVSAMLPLVPDAAIQLRCGDMVPSSDVYGFLPFSAYLELIPQDSRHIYVLTVAVKFGGDPFLDYIRLARARVTICSASTFCLWPAIASNGTAYFPASRLLAGWQRGQRNDSLHLGRAFRWLEQPPLIHSFSDTTSLKEAVDTLTA